LYNIQKSLDNGIKLGALLMSKSYTKNIHIIWIELCYANDRLGFIFFF